MLGSIPTLIAYVDPALIGCLDIRRLASRILRARKLCGVVDKVSYIQGSALVLVIIHCPHVSTASLSKGCIRLPALQPLLCLSKSYVGEDGHGHLVYKYTWTIGYCATWCNTPVPSSCCSLVAFNSRSLGGSFMVPKMVMTSPIPVF